MNEMVQEDGLLVACMCATWCKTCTEFRITFDALASLSWPDCEAVAVPEEIACLPAALERARRRT